MKHIDNMDTSKMNNRIEDLIKALKNSQKFDTARFFENLSQRIKTVDDKKYLEAMIIEIGKISPIAQYGSFTSNEECLLASLQNEAALLKNILNEQ